MTVDVWIMPMLVSVTLTLMQGHSGSTKAKQIGVELMLSATKPAIRRLASFYVTLTLQTFIRHVQLVYNTLFLSLLEIRQMHFRGCYLRPRKEVESVYLTSIPDGYIYNTLCDFVRLGRLIVQQRNKINIFFLLMDLCCPLFCP